ncbi:MAG: DUF1998 domain-containing protein, partial [Anaerolineae bacterium]|nr:DUF1998 domain-containing protein [Anaerolineae bacterium]
NEAYRLANTLDNLTTLCRACHQRVEQGQRLRTGLGGLAFALGSIAPLHLMCDPRDISVVAEQQAAADGLPTVTVYEKIPAGIGFSQQLYEIRDDLLRAVEDLVRRCPCERGCPACVGPISEEADEAVDAKALTLALVEACLAIPAEWRC